MPKGTHFKKMSLFVNSVSLNNIGNVFRLLAFLISNVLI